jgi:hypothetical protein
MKLTPSSVTGNGHGFPEENNLPLNVRAGFHQLLA